MALRNIILVVLLVQTPSVSVVANANHDSKLSSSSQFKLWENKQLLGYSFKRFDSPSLILCNQQCSRNQRCASTNFKLSSKKDGQGTCELNNHEMFVADGNINFGHRDGVALSVRLLECPQGWHRHGSSCYLIHDTPTTIWSDALAFCQNHDAHLPIIKSADENDFIFRLIMSHPNARNGGAWIGLKRKKDNEFYWMDDTLLAGQFTAWAQGEPNCLSEKCAFIFTRGDRQNQWHDSPCIIDGATGFSVPVVLCQKSIS